LDPDIAAAASGTIAQFPLGQGYSSLIKEV
jgi:hypothetical protein